MKHIGEPCERCGTSLVGISAKSAKQITSRRNAARYRTMIKRSDKGGPDHDYLICPECDAYALGIEMVKPPYQLTRYDGSIADIQELAKSGEIFGERK